MWRSIPTGPSVARPIVLTLRWVAPACRHAVDVVGGDVHPRLRWTRPSMPMRGGVAAGRLRAGAYVARAPHPAAVPARTWGNHPSASRPARRRAAGWLAPNQIGMGRWTGIGARPAPVTRLVPAAEGDAPAPSTAGAGAPPAR